MQQMNRNIPKFYVCDEMQKLRAGLNQREVAWEDATDKGTAEFWICRTYFKIDGKRWSVVHGYGTYGGFSHFYKDKGLLEYWARQDAEPIGWTTAAVILERVDAVREAAEILRKREGRT